MVTGGGTLTANNPISLVNVNDDILSNSSLTLWKIVEQQDRNRSVASDDLLNQFINYIIKIDDNQKDIFSVTKSNDEELDTKRGYSVANLGDELVLKINDGYTITEAYNGDEKLVDQDDQGRYILKVSAGGGVNLKINYKEKEPDPTPTPDEKPDESSPSDSDKGEQIVIRFVPPTTGIDAPINKTSMTKKGILYALDALIVSLALLSFNRRRSDRQFVKNVM